jgi:hypothetical protein
MNARTAIFMLMLASPTCWAYDKNYCPFPPGMEPASKAEVCEVVCRRQAGDRELALFAIGPGTILAIQESDPNGGLSASLIEKEKVVGGPVALGNVARGGLKVWTANLTSKAGPRKDVILAVPGESPVPGVCGQTVFFFLRSKSGYTTAHGETCRLDANDFVDLNEDGQVEWIQTEFIRGCVGRDGKAHNYWVSNLIQFRDGRPTLANGIDERFPSWIWFTYKPNHKNTVQLTDAQKKQLFRDQADGLPIYTAPRVAKGK